MNAILHPTTNQNQNPNSNANALYRNFDTSTTTSPNNEQVVSPQQQQQQQPSVPSLETIKTTDAEPAIPYPQNG